MATLVRDDPTTQDEVVETSKRIIKPTQCCNFCHRSGQETVPPIQLKQCSACKLAKYCSQNCQKQHWPTHKRTCTYKHQLKELTNLSSEHTITVESPFTKLESNTYLDNRSASSIYTILTDTFRLHVEDSYLLRNKIVRGSIYDEPLDNGMGCFVEFLSRVEGNKHNLLPDWWDDKHLQACLEYATSVSASVSEIVRPESGVGVGRIFHLIEETDITDRYGISGVLELRLLAEQIYGRNLISEEAREWAGMMLENERQGSVV